MLNDIEVMFDRLGKMITLEKNYAALFRASIALMALWLIALGQGAAVIYEIERDAYKLRYELEVYFKVDLPKIDCAKIEDRQADCLLAQYQMKAARTSVNLLDEIMQGAAYMAIVFGLLALLGFLLDLVKSSNAEVKKYEHKGMDVRQKVQARRSYRQETKLTIRRN